MIKVICFFDYEAPLQIKFEKLCEIVSVWSTAEEL